MTKEQVQTLPTNELRAILRSTNPAGKFWLEMVWASDEMDRRLRWRQAFGRGPNAGAISEHSAGIPVCRICGEEGHTWQRCGND